MSAEDQPDPAVPWEQQPTARWQPTGEPAKRGRRALIAIIVSVLLVAGVSVGAHALTGSGAVAGTGAASPQDVLQQAVTAAESLDGQALLDLVNPAEVRGLDGVQQAITSPGSALSPLVLIGTLAKNTVAISITGLSTSVQNVRSDIAFVTITGGTAEASVDLSQLPMQFGGNSPMHKSISLAGTPPLAMIKSAGRWYFSPTTTALEALRRARNLPAPDWNAPAVPGGASTPAGVLTDLVQAADARDVKAAVGLVAADDIPALGYYYEVFLGQIGAPGPDGAVSDLKLTNLDTSTSDLADGLTKVTVNAATLSWTAQGQQHTATYRSGSDCIDVTVSGQAARQECAHLANFQQVTKIKDVFFVAAKGAKGWQLSPTATVMEYLRLAVTNADLTDLLRLAGLQQLVPVSATVPADSATQVSLNAAGFAHISVTGPPGSCVTVGSDTFTGTLALKAVSGGSGSGCPGGVQLGSGGSAGAVLELAEPTGSAVSGTVTLTAG